MKRRKGEKKLLNFHLCHAICWKSFPGYLVKLLKVIIQLTMKIGKKPKTLCYILYPFFLLLWQLNGTRRYSK